MLAANLLGVTLALILVLDSFTQAVEVQLKAEGAKYTHCLDRGSQSIQLADPFPESWVSDRSFIAMEWFKVSVNYTSTDKPMGMDYINHKFPLNSKSEWNRDWDKIEGLSAYQFWGLTIETPNLNTTNGSYLAIFLEPMAMKWVSITVVDTCPPDTTLNPNLSSNSPDGPCGVAAIIATAVLTAKVLM